MHEDPGLTIIRHYSGICMKALNKITEILSQDGRYPSRDL